MGAGVSMDPAVFVGRVDADGKIHLDFPKQQRAYCKRTLANQAVDVIICAAGEMKTRLQEKGFHAMITPWANGEGHRIDDLKRDLLRAIFGEREHVNPITGEVTMGLCEPHTSKLNRAQYIELIERTLELGAECGQILLAPDEYKRMKAAEMRKASKGKAA